MVFSQDEFVSRVAERVIDNRGYLRNDLVQRRNQAVDIFGQEYTRQGGNGFPASFYISISPDMVYLERFEFKLIIQPFVSTSGAGTNVSIPVIRETSLTINDQNRIVPNPHTHEVVGHTHGLSGGIATTPVTASDFRVMVEGIDVSAYLMAQHGAWIDGEGIYPAIDINKNYDLLEVASDMFAEGRDGNEIVKPGYKKTDIISGELLSATLVLYEKYSHLNR